VGNGESGRDNSPIDGSLRGETSLLYCPAVRDSSAQLTRSMDLTHALEYGGQVDDSGGEHRRCVEGAKPEYVDKAIAYIPRGDRFVVFEEPDSPLVGIQVPGGTVEAGESLEAAVLREAYEETG